MRTPRVGAGLIPSVAVGLSRPCKSLRAGQIGADAGTGIPEKINCQTPSARRTFLMILTRLSGVRRAVRVRCGSCPRRCPDFNAGRSTVKFLDLYFHEFIDTKRLDRSSN